jgi:hypothetical protein
MNVLLEVASEHPWFVLFVSSFLLLGCLTLVDCAVLLIRGVHLLSGRRVIPTHSVPSSDTVRAEWPSTAC